ncbi:MAG: HAD-IA family hydrolase [Xanthomonadales bacterium]|nr:HAD-IA family hydrolase [Gammaproteobacteria bacterium]MBT8055021.1 HAD-IA family hydrolase [Gammaproteobacteria bacterium]NND56403.1 HAD-IA family hydrolase [Xanthomonadales bacterium]NNK50460.1 HAD-IA family hydrolase [Xanthomonadales bacterium]
MNRIKAVLFDLDGTLLDSAPDLVGSLNWVRETEGLPPLPVSEMSPFASKGAVGLLKAGMPETTENQLESWRLRFLEHYAENSYRHSTLYQGVPELLDFLGQENIPWGIVTNKIESLTFPIVEAAELQDAISCVVCGDTLNESKPHPAPVTLACGILQVSPEETLFAGDDIRDIQAGKAAGTQTAAVFYGYGSHELTGEDVAASLPVHHPADISRAVQSKP